MRRRRKLLIMAGTCILIVIGCVRALRGEGEGGRETLRLDGVSPALSLTSAIRVNG